MYTAVRWIQSNTYALGNVPPAKKICYKRNKNRIWWAGKILFENVSFCNYFMIIPSVGDTDLSKNVKFTLWVIDIFSNL